jgi:signal transduction histidine kinase
VISIYGYLGYAIYLLVKGFNQTRSPLQRNRIRYLLVGAIIVSLGTVSNFAPELQAFPVDVACALLNAGIIAVAIGRHKLLDISIVIRKGLLYSIPTLIIGTTYFLLLSLAIIIFHASGTTQLEIAFGLALLLALLTQPLRDRAQLWVDRFFFREKYNLTQMLLRLSRTAASTLDLDSLTNMILEDVTSTIHINRAAFLLKEDKSGNFLIHSQRGLSLDQEYFFRRDHPVLNWLSKNEKALTKAEFETLTLSQALWGSERDLLDQLDAELFVPVVAKGELVGLFTFGLKNSEELYSQEDVLTFTTLADQTAVAISNARLYRQLEGTLAALRKAHDQLELRVQERTNDLAKANQALQVENIERLRAEQEIKHYAAELERSNQELQQFAYVASHDLQEPLRMVSSYMQLLERRYSNQLQGDAKDFINFAVDGAKRMQSLIDDLLAYSRVGTRGKPFEQIDLSKVLLQSESNLKISIEENNAEVQSTSLPTIWGDGTQMIQLFQNLISNALKFHGEATPKIRVSAEDQNGCHHIIVSDNGIGIDPQYTERIFLIFQRLHTREEYPGTGIGLAICKRIVERHGGQIWVESNLGKGAAFHFTIPTRERYEYEPSG